MTADRDGHRETRADDATLVGGADSGPPEGSAPSLVDQKVVEAAIRRGLITAVQGGMILEGVTGKPNASALGSLVERGLVTPDAASELEDEVKSDFVPGYRLVCELGRGAMGVVYKAVQKRLDRTVALKVVTPGQQADPGYLRRFKQEALALGKLNHPNIVQVYDYGDVGGKVYLALELIDGRDGAAVLASKGTFPEREAVQVVRDAALGLAHAAAAGITHRDVKPANLMLCAAKDARSGPWVTKVTDLGLARVSDPAKGDAQMTKAGTILGSPAYMAPEQTRGEAADWRADQYALGATLYHLVTGQVPYADSSAIQVIVKKQTEPLDDPRDHVPRLSEGLVRVLDRMLARPPGARYSTYEALVEDLDAVLRGEAPTTPPVLPDASSLRFAAGRAPASPPTTRMAAVKSTPAAPALPPAPAPPAPPAAVAPRGGPRPVVAAALAGVALLGVAGVVARRDPPAPPGPGPGPEVTTATTGPTAAQAAEKALTALAGLGPADRLAQAPLVRDQLEALPEGERLPLRLRLADLVGQALDATLAGRIARHEELLAKADYAGLAAVASDTAAVYQGLRRELPPRLADLAAVAARAAREGEEERRLWARLDACKDPLEVLALEEELGRRFPWSPSRAAAAERRKAAEAWTGSLEVALVDPPAARVTLDGRPLGPLPWTGRVTAGPHDLVAEADGYFVREVRVDVAAGPAPVAVRLRLDPKPARPLVRSSRFERPVWTPSPGLSVQRFWATTGTWTAAAERAALVGEAGDDAWATATRDLARLVAQAAASEGARGWQLDLEVLPPATGALEVRLLGAGEAAVVVGVEGGRAYLGLRQGERLERLAERPLPPPRAADDPTRPVQLDWDGRVALVRVGRDLLGSTLLPWPLPEAAPLVVAVRGGQGEVRALTLRALIESGAR